MQTKLDKINEIISKINKEIGSEDVYIKENQIFFLEEKVIDVDKITNEQLDKNTGWHSWNSLKNVITKKISQTIIEKYGSCFKVSDVVDLFDSDDVLNEIGVEECKSHFDLVDESDLDDLREELSDENDEYCIKIYLKDKKNLNDSFKEELLQEVLEKYSLEELEKLLR